MSLIQDIVIILFAAIIIIVIFSRLKIPSVVGFLLTGVIIGPYSTGLIKDTHDIEILAEIGVVLMMFIIGIEFSIKKLIRIKKLIFIGGGGQVILTIVTVLLISMLFNFSFVVSLFFGFLVSLSSTAIVLKLLQDKKQIDTPHGKIELGILLFQDLCVVPMVILTPILAFKEGVSIGDNLLKIGIAALSINIIFFTARKLMPHMLNLIVKTRLKEIFIISSLFLCIGMAFLTNYLGLSLALGSFIAGLIISESRYSHQVAADIMPFKESFNSVFFISVGMLLNLEYFYSNIPTVFLLAVGLFSIKSLIIFILVLGLKYPLRIAVISAMGLAQVGEFSFILAKLGLKYELLTDMMFQAFLASSILTMTFTPFAFLLSPGVARRAEQGRLLSPIRKRQEKYSTESYTTEEKNKLNGHVIIVGYGLNGRNLAAVLSSRKIPFVIIELNPDNVEKAVESGYNTVYGDATNPKILEAAMIKTAKVITFAISDPMVIDNAVSAGRFLNKELYIIARTKYVSDIDRLYEQGANMVFAEEYEASIEILARVMSEYGFSKEAINKEINKLHSERYAMIRRNGEKTGVSLTAGKTHQKLQTEINTDSVTVTEISPSVNKTIGELDIRAKTGATIISVIRGGENIPNPQPSFTLKEKDIVVFMGNNQQLEKASEFFS